MGLLVVVFPPVNLKLKLMQFVAYVQQLAMLVLLCLDADH